MVCGGAMIGVFRLLGKLDDSVLYGAALGCGICILNLFLLRFTMNRAAAATSPQAAQQIAKASVPKLDVVAEDADLTIRFGVGRYTDVEHVCLLKDEVTPLASPAFVEEHGPFENTQDLQGVPLLYSPLEPWRTWFAAHELDWPEPSDGSQFNDVGLMCDAAAHHLGVALVRLKLGTPWLQNGTLVRLFDRTVPSPHAHYLCWRPGNMDRWECAAFADWLTKAL